MAGPQGFSLGSGVAQTYMPPSAQTYPAAGEAAVSPPSFASVFNRIEKTSNYLTDVLSRVNALADLLQPEPMKGETSNAITPALAGAVGGAMILAETLYGQVMHLERQLGRIERALNG